MYSSSHGRDLLISIATLLCSAALVNSVGVTGKQDCTAVQSCLTEGEYSSGPYEIKVGEAKRPVKVSCDLQTEGGGWTVIQRRVDDTVSFNRSWEDYSKGFGDPLGNFWIGLSILHSIVIQKRYVLRIDLEDYDGNRVFAQYSDFLIDDYACKYKLVKIGEYCGNATDSLSAHVGYKFSTIDQDNDLAADSCSKVCGGGGWWFYTCYVSSLNGKYKTSGVPATTYDYISWSNWKGYFYSIRKVEMKIRPYLF